MDKIYVKLSRILIKAEVEVSTNTGKENTLLKIFDKKRDLNFMTILRTVQNNKKKKKIQVKNKRTKAYLISVHL
jgi:hypothetical protein